MFCEEEQRLHPVFETSEKTSHCRRLVFRAAFRGQKMP